MLHVPVQEVMKWPASIVTEWQAFIKIKNAEAEMEAKRSKNKL